jgi:4-hydroxy-tetrahydrodipicolinate synthase
MTIRGFEILRTYGGDGSITGGAIFGTDDPGFWEAYWRADHQFCSEHLERTERVVNPLYAPEGWDHAKMKAALGMLGHPVGHVRRPRLPISDPAKLSEIRRTLEKNGMLPTTLEAS